MVEGRVNVVFEGKLRSRWMVRVGRMVQAMVFVQAEAFLPYTL